RPFILPSPSGKPTASRSTIESFFLTLLAISSYSKIRLRCFWNGNLETDEVLAVVLRTGDFLKRRPHAPPALQASIGHRKGPGILDVDRDIDRASIGRQFPAFDHMHLHGMGRAVIVGKGPVGLADGIDDERVAAFVMTDRFSVPGRFDIGRM